MAVALREEIPHGRLRAADGLCSSSCQCRIHPPRSHVWHCCCAQEVLYKLEKSATGGWVGAPQPAIQMPAAKGAAGKQQQQ